MYDSWDLLRWQRAICSPVFAALSKYAALPRASAYELERLELPAHLPASPEMYESPRLATHGVPSPGPSAAAGPAWATAVRPPVASSPASTAALRRWRAPKPRRAWRGWRSLEHWRADVMGSLPEQTSWCGVNAAASPQRPTIARVPPGQVTRLHDLYCCWMVTCPRNSPLATLSPSVSRARWPRW